MLRAGIVGAGDIAFTHHLPAYAKHDEVIIDAICDPDSKRRQAATSEYAVDHEFSCYKDMFDTRDIDLVSICTPPDSHREIAVSAADYGVSFLCEKPASITIADARAMITAAEEADVVAAGGYTLQFSPTFKRSIDQISNHVLGEIKHVSVYYYIKKGATDGWRIDPQRSGGGVMMDLFPHILSYLHRITDGELSVSSATSSRFSAPNIEAEVSLEGSLGEVPFRVKTGYRSNGGPKRFFIQGTDGTCEVTPRYETLDVSGNPIQYSRSGLPEFHLGSYTGGTKFTPLISRYSTYSEKGQGISRVLAFVDAVLGCSPNRAPLSEAVEILSIIKEVYNIIGVESPLTQE